MVVPVFALFLAAVVEFGHAYMVQTALRGAAKKAARLGVAESVSTAAVDQEARRIMGAAVRTNTLRVLIKNANLFDTSQTVPQNLRYEELPDIELNEAGTRQLFIVRLELPYESVALFPPFWVKNVVLHSQSVMRHE